MRMIIGVIALCLTACQTVKEDAGNMQFQAVMESTGDTKTILSSAGEGVSNVLWSYDDKIGVYIDGGATAVPFTLTEGAGTKSATFSGEGSGSGYLAVYPLSMASSRSGNTVQITLPKEQTYAPASFSDGAYPMVAVSSSHLLSFRNLCSVVCLSITGTQTVDRIVFRSKDSSAKVSGSATVDVSHPDQPVLSMNRYACDSVAINTGGVKLNESSATDFYLVLPPQTYPGGFTVRIYADGSYMEKSYERDFTMLRSRMHRAGTIDYTGKPKPPVTSPDGNIIVGYATYWDKTMPDPALLTHINYAFAHIKSDFETLDIKKESRLGQIAALKKTHPNLKVMLSVGGWEAGNFSEMAADATHRKNFCNNCLAAVRKYGLDGIDLDWEYPTSNAAGISSSPEDTDNFTLLIKDLRATLGADMLITMASAANAKYVDFKSVIGYMNWVNIMTYDMGKPPYHNAGLYKSSMTKRSCDESVALHHKAGVPYEKMVLGVPFYGHGNGTDFTADCLDYRDIKYDSSQYSFRWDNDAQVPYLVNAAGTMVLSYDDETSVGLKADYVKQKGLKGAMYWNIEADDDNWTLSKAIASRLIGWTYPETPSQETILATNQYIQKFLEEVNYPCTNNPDTDAEYSYSSVIGYPGGGPSENDEELPPVYSITWTASSSSQKLKVWEGSWSREYSLSGGVGKQDITNLVPNTTYHWQVSNSNSTIVAKGSFSTTGLLHQVYFAPNVRNGRDLGGYKGLGGKTTVYHKLYRGGRIDGKYCNSTGRSEMLAEGIRAEVDLREADDVPSGSPLGSSVAFYAPGFDSGYNHMVRDNPEKVKNTFCWVVDRLREGKPVYFHCAAGRDRTATLAVLLEGALGISENDMAKDYELTYFSPKDWGMSKDENGNYYYAHVRTVYSYKSIRKTIFSKTDSGTYQERIVKYLLQIGVPPNDIDDLRSIMLQ